MLLLCSNADGYPDSRHLIASGQGRIVKVNTETGQMEVVVDTCGGEDYIFPSVSEDGQRITFSHIMTVPTGRKDPLLGTEVKKYGDIAVIQKCCEMVRRLKLED